MPRPTLQREFEPLTADDLDLLGSWEMVGRKLAYLEARSVVRVGRLQRWLNGDPYYEGDKLTVDGRLGTITIRRLQVLVATGGVSLDGETSWYVQSYVSSHPDPQT